MIGYTINGFKYPSVQKKPAITANIGPSTIAKGNNITYLYLSRRKKIVSNYKYFIPIAILFAQINFNFSFDICKVGTKQDQEFQNGNRNSGYFFVY